MIHASDAPTPEEIKATWASLSSHAFIDSPWITAWLRPSPERTEAILLVMMTPWKRREKPTVKSMRQRVTFKRETGVLDHRPMYRVVCNGVVVELGLRSAR